jgi:ATP-binding protein involved in chromosome partitioning
LDADIYGPNVPTMMGVRYLPQPKNVNPANPEEVQLVPAEAYGVKMMSIGFLGKPGQPLIWRGPMLHSAIRQFLGDVLWGELDYLIIDLPPGTGDAQLSLAQSIPLSGGVIVTLPQQVSLEDAARGLAMFRELNVAVLGVVENMSYLEMPDGTVVDIFGSGGGQKLADASGVPFIGSIPIDPAVRAGGDAGTPIVVSHPESPAAKSLQAVAQSLAGLISVEALKGSSGVQINVV